MHIYTLALKHELTRSACCVPSTSKTAGKTSWITGRRPRLGWGVFLHCIQYLCPSTTLHTHTHARAHTYMALGETVRTTSTSLGSPDHLHPEDCGKLRVMWILFHKASCSPEQLADHSGLFSVCSFPLQRQEVAVRDELLADVNESCWLELGSLECFDYASHGYY